MRGVAFVGDGSGENAKLLVIVFGEFLVCAEHMLLEPGNRRPVELQEHDQAVAGLLIFLFQLEKGIGEIVVFFLVLQELGIKDALLHALLGGEVIHHVLLQKLQGAPDLFLAAFAQEGVDLPEQLLVLGVHEGDTPFHCLGPKHTALFHVK